MASVKPQPFVWQIVSQAFVSYKEVQDVVPPYVGKIATYTTEYETKLQRLWNEFKAVPTRENAQRLAEEMKSSAETLWPAALADILGVAALTERQTEVLLAALDNHKGFIDGSLLPDITRMFDEPSGVLSGDMWSRFDHRTVFMYAGALWSLGFLATVMFDGLDVRDLTDLFIFAGPDDVMTSEGDRGCAQFANKIFTVADILARDIIPGHLQCLTNCRHMLIPIGSPLTKETRLKGGTGSGNHGHTGRPGKIGGSGPGDNTPYGAVILAKTAQEWFDEQQAVSEQWSKEAMDRFEREKPHTEMTREDFAGYLKRMGDHRRLILDEGMDIVLNRKPGTLADPKEFMQRLMVHDKDKYDHNIAEAYVGTFKFDRKVYEGAFTAAMNNHHLNNDHHYEHWVHKGKATEMSPMAFWEMMADWRGTARERGTPYGAYYAKFGGKMDLHPRTRSAVEFELGKLK